ncbi:MAG TPA: hypothetical protein VFH99_02915 [Candidatus Saccharimonadales bacterium]|nr:hypothetical protein [Candidatus Saccharimonadales bacterium]
MKKIISLVVITVSVVMPVITPISAQAVDSTVQPPASTPASSQPDVLITTFGGSSMLEFAELYNQSDAPVQLTGAQLRFTVHDLAAGCVDRTYSATAPAGWLLPKSYFSFERGAPNGDATEAHFSVPDDFLAGCVSAQLSAIQLLGADGTNWQNITFLPGTLTANNWAQHKQRGKSSLSVTGTFAADYNLLATGTAGLYSTPLYQPPPDTAGLQIVELLPRSLSCSPTDTSLLCDDYVKLFNGSGTTIDLVNYRLRTSYGGLKTSSSNTISLSGDLAPGQYQLVNTKNDGSALGLTQTGGYVWLEDAYGAQTYQPVIEYPDASTDSKTGQAWAFDGADWQWTSSPQPAGPNYFPLVVLTAPAMAAPSLKPCAVNQERNPETNRCRAIATATAVPAVCKPGQERNPDTGRCKSITAIVKTATPCKQGQERNPATNRCRSVLGAAKSQKPCKAGQKRNPDTGRCRKIQPKITAIHDIKTAARAAGQHWYAIAAVVAAAGVYILYEWHPELSIGWERLKARMLRRQNIQNLLK